MQIVFNRINSLYEFFSVPLCLCEITTRTSCEGIEY